MLHEYPNNAVLKHAVELALMIMQYAQRLEDERRFVIARQILRSGTSIGANIVEAQSAESKK